MPPRLKLSWFTPILHGSVWISLPLGSLLRFLRPGWGHPWTLIVPCRLLSRALIASPLSPSQGVLSVLKRQIQVPAHPTPPSVLLGSKGSWNFKWKAPQKGVGVGAKVSLGTVRDQGWRRRLLILWAWPHPPIFSGVARPLINNHRLKCLWNLGPKSADLSPCWELSLVKLG